MILSRPLLALMIACAAPAAEQRVTLLQTTDLHDHGSGAGHVDAAPSDLGGYARIAAYVEQVRAACGHPVLLVDSGDWSMGTLDDLTLERRPLALGFAETLRYDCITLGNHDFDHTPAGLAGTLRAAVQDFGFRTPIVASNLELHGDPDLAPFLGPGRAIRRSLTETLANGLVVGFIGLMGREAAGVAPAAAPVRFTDYHRDYGPVQERVDRLRAQGCRLIVALDHAGTDADGRAGEDIDLARHVAGIDVIASGHAHNPLDSARSVRNGAWTTRVICAGAFGSHVARIDLAFPASGPPRLEGSGNAAMTDAVLAALDPPARPDPAVAALVRRADLELNRALAPVFNGVARFPDYTPGDPARGIYHPVARCAQDLRSNDRDAMPAPNGLGELCADALRATANGLLAPGARDPTPYAAAAVATGELRGGLEAGPPITFADLYGILPLGLSPDPAQRGSTGEPLVSGYVEADALRALCAMQLMAQTGLAGPDDYINLSGLSCVLDPPETAAFFACAFARTALRLARQRAAEGSAQAGRALAAVAGLACGQDAALLGAAAAGNPFALAMVRLDDPDPARVAGHLALMARLARAEARDAATGSSGLDALLMAQAMAAIGPVSAFAPSDPDCTGPARPLAPGRHRIVLDRYLLLMVDGVRSRFGIEAAVYQEARGGRTLSGTPDGLRAILDNRISLDPGRPFQEVKGWMALLAYLARGAPFAGGMVPPAYGSSGDFSQFPAFGAAVRIRNAGYPHERVGALEALAAALRRAS